MSLSRALGFSAGLFTATLAGFGLIALAGCTVSASTDVNDILNEQLLEQNGRLQTQDLRVVLVNQTQSNIELDMTIDGQLTTLTCTSADKRYEYRPTTCPTNMELVQERRLSDLGALVGGRNYNHNVNFIFTRDEFDCESTLVITFTEDQTKAQVL